MSNVIASILNQHFIDVSINLPSELKWTSYGNSVQNSIFLTSFGESVLSDALTALKHKIENDP